ncbi:MAG: hypothetical protein D6798_01890 [Deltaproteobacteria bacterium]|nr:MAG: hypothetical protein D6798_01890 [Deltaproteobacteria bacterium]
MTRWLAMALVLVAVVAAVALGILALGLDDDLAAAVSDEGALARCAHFPDEARRERCEERVLASTSRTAEIEAAIAASDDPQERDLLRLQLLYLKPVEARRLCGEMEGDQAREICQRFEGRGHLWRDGKGGSHARSKRRR